MSALLPELAGRQVHRPGRGWLRWAATLKFKIVLLAVVTGVLSAAGAAVLVIGSAEDSMRRLVLANAKDDAEQSAAALSTRTSTLMDALSAVARSAPPNAWTDQAAMGRYLLDKPALGALFASVYGAGVDGKLLARVEAGRLAGPLPSVADRAYFKQAIRSNVPVISDVLWGDVSKAPIVIFAVPALDSDGRHVGVLAGSITLRSTALFATSRPLVFDGATRDLVIDRGGHVVWHDDPSRVMQGADNEPGLRSVLQAWMAADKTASTGAVASVRGAYVVSVAPVHMTDWASVRIAPTAVAFAPVSDAQAAAWPAAGGAGLLAGLLAGGLGYALTRPISRLRAWAESLLRDGGTVSGWPADGGEVGELTTALRTLVEQRQQRQIEVDGLLHQLEAVLDHADIGIALTRNGRFEIVSQQFCTIFGVEKVDAVGNSTRMIYASDEAFQSLIARAGPAFKEQGAFDGELELVRGSGQTFWARMRGRAVVPGDVAMGTIWTIEDVTMARLQRERLTYSASHDALTGLLNRAAFEIVLEEAASASASEPFCALFIDLDRFKQVNDTGGHAAGDALLRDVSHILTQQLRRSDVVARLGGDEFAVLLPACPSLQAQAIADKLCAAVSAYALDWCGVNLSVGASIGLVEADGSFSTAADVLRAADSACYQAKRRGRCRVEVFESSAQAALEVG